MLEAVSGQWKDHLKDNTGNWDNGLNNDSRRWTLLAALIFAAFTFAAFTGRLATHRVDDTPSYIEYPFDSLSAALTSIRTPGYPAFLRLLDMTLGLSAAAAVQWIVSCVSAWWFALELQRWNASTVAVWASALAIVFGCTSLDHQSTLSTDAIAASIGVVTVAFLLRWVRRGRRHVDAALVVFAVIAAIMIRPAYLSIIVWIAMMGTWLMPPTMALNPSLRRRLLSSFCLSGVCVLLIVGWMAMRWIVVNEFGLLPFGHQNLAGLTVQMVDDDELREIAQQDSDPVVLQLVAGVIELKYGQFQPGPGLPTMTLENQWNDLIYQAVVPAATRVFPDDPIAAHQLIGQLNQSIVKRYPLRYGRWLLLASRRAVWGVAADLLMNPVFLGWGLIFVCVWFFQAMAGQVWRVDAGARQVSPMKIHQIPAVKLIAVISVSYAVVMIGFVILTSPPLGRFADAGAIFVPCWIVVWASESALSQFRSIETL